MDNIYILKEIARWDKQVWKLFSLLNREMNEYFCILGREYELNFRRIDKNEIGIYYKLDDKCHRSDGPAMIYNDGSEFWFVNGKLHRLDGSAVIRKNNYNGWYKNGKLHRLDGPAIEYYKDDMKINNRWYIDGERIKIE